jgi:hypothetical protein
MASATTSGEAPNRRESIARVCRLFADATMHDVRNVSARGAKRHSGARA